MSYEGYSEDMLRAVVIEKDKQIVSLEERVETMVRLNRELSRPIFSRRGSEDDIIDQETESHPRTRRQVAVFCFLVIMAVAAVLLITPLTSSL